METDASKVVDLSKVDIFGHSKGDSCIVFLMHNFDETGESLEFSYSSAKEAADCFKVFSGLMSKLTKTQ